MKRFLSAFSPKAPLLYVYMMQQFEYNTSKFTRWFIGLPNFFGLQKRGRLQLTNRARLMVLIAYGSWIISTGLGLFLALQNNPLFVLLTLAAPLLSGLSLTVTTAVLQNLVVNPKQAREIKAAKTKLLNHSGRRIAVLGSYGKTSMKELLLTVLSEGKNVAATPGNKNVLVSHARWINQKLTGDEDVLIFEYGESKPGDIQAFASLSQPNIALVTGLAPAHLDEYASLEAVADDFAAISQTVQPADTYVHNDSELLHQKLKGLFYDQSGMEDWKVSELQVDFSGTHFVLQSKDRKLELKTGLLGTHQVGPLAAVVAVAVKLGLSDSQITTGVAKTLPYEHRMQPRHLHGAWIIDDTYNGNIEGMRAGLDLLKALPGKKKIYVTPGLVDQGIENEPVHLELGALIAAAHPDKVVLMQNSATVYIQAGLQQGNYGGEVVLETNPLDYYTNLEHFLAAGDVVLMQNDWPDSYR